MWKAFRGMLTFTLPNLAGMVGFAAISTVGACLTGVPGGAENLFRTYFVSFPLMSMLFLFMFGFSLSTTNLQLLVSFGCTRRDYFRGLQLTVVLYVLTGLVLSFGMAALPGWLNWAELERYAFMMHLGGLAPLSYCLVAAAVLALGSLSGMVLARSKVWGVLLLAVGILVSIAAMVLLMLTSIIDGPDAGRLWGHLPAILTGVMLAVFVASECLLRRFVGRYSVR